MLAILLHGIILHQVMGTWVNRTTTGDIYISKTCEYTTHIINNNSMICKCDDLFNTFYIENGQLNDRFCYRDDYPLLEKGLSANPPQDVIIGERNKINIICNISESRNTISIWNYFNANLSAWQDYKLSVSEFNRIFDISSHQNLILKERSKWNGLLVLFHFQCLNNLTALAYAKFTGERYYPLPLDINALFDFKLLVERKKKTGAVVGVVIFFLIVIIAGGLLLMWFLKRRKEKTITQVNNNRKEEEEENNEIYEPLTKVYDEEKYENPSNIERNNEYSEPTNSDGYEQLVKQENSSLVQDRCETKAKPKPQNKKLAVNIKWYNRKSIKNATSSESVKYQKPSAAAVSLDNQSTKDKCSYEEPEYKNLNDVQIRTNSDTKPKLPTIVKTPSGADEFRNKRTTIPPNLVPKAKSKTTDGHNNTDPAKKNSTASETPYSNDETTDHYKTPSLSKEIQKFNTAFRSPTSQSSGVKERIAMLLDNNESKLESLKTVENGNAILNKGDVKKAPPKTAPKVLTANGNRATTVSTSIYETMTGGQETYINLQDI